MKIQLVVISAAMIVLSSGCATKEKNIEPESTTSYVNNLEHVCVANNPYFKADRIDETIKEVFYKHGLRTSFYKKDAIPASCNHRVYYTHNGIFDTEPYLNQIDITMYKNKQEIGSVEYVLENTGGVNTDKFKSTKSKLTPVLEKLLKDYKREEIDYTINDREVEYIKEVAPQNISATSSVLEQKLTELQSLHTKGLITEGQYNMKREQLLEMY
ncbi:hypothetical protein JHD48_03265 [Sulfurimonas sp. SAG-AH-194-I05]|nr:Sbal_3080 family lipoprotein [Sulfurimonas sp. SAG-AH-194-I05]MDF1874753.1 hypothetical protein [Sulfurimonas sp. SAG-AH-194-I05]